MPKISPICAISYGNYLLVLILGQALTTASVKKILYCLVKSRHCSSTYRRSISLWTGVKNLLNNIPLKSHCFLYTCQHCVLTTFRLVHLVSSAVHHKNGATYTLINTRGTGLKKLTWLGQILDPTSCFFVVGGTIVPFFIKCGQRVKLKPISSLLILVVDRYTAVWKDLARFHHFG